MSDTWKLCGAVNETYPLICNCEAGHDGAHIHETQGVIQAWGRVPKPWVLPDDDAFPYLPAWLKDFLPLPEFGRMQSWDDSPIRQFPPPSPSRGLEL